MFMGRRKKPINIEQFVDIVKNASKGNNASQDIKQAVLLLLRSYGIETPVRK